MEESEGRSPLHAVAFFSALGAGLVVSLLLVLALIVAVVGGRFGPFLEVLLMGSVVGGGIGGLFAGGVLLLRGRSDGEGLENWKAAVAGAGAAFLAPLLLGLLFLPLHSASLLQVVAEFVSEAWWLPGLGGAIGLGLNQIAKRAELTSGEQSEKLEPGTASLAAGDS